MKDRINATSIKGAPPGYVGYNDSNKTICDHIRRHHLSVVVLDEIDEAHEDILDTFLKAFERGYMEDAHGRKVHLNNTFFILTSNISSKIMRRDRKEMGFAAGTTGDDGLLAQALKVIRNRFKRKFVDRIDEIVVANNLTEPDLFNIARLAIDEALRPVFDQGYTVDYDDLSAILSLVVKQAVGKDEKYTGARNVSRTVERMITLPIAEVLATNHSNSKMLRLFAQQGAVVVRRV
jgi:ATP-dependent Clp protease ATP-binding subunit ClpA